MQDKNTCCNQDCNQGRECPVRVQQAAAQTADKKARMKVAAALGYEGVNFAWSYLTGAISELVKAESELVSLKSQASPAAVAVADERAVFEKHMAGANLHRTQFDDYENNYVHGKWEAWQARAALAATPAAAESVVLPEEIPASNTLWMFLTKGMTQSAIAGMPERDRKVLTERAQENWAAIRAEVGATVPVMLPEPDAVINEVMELVKDWAQRDLIAVEAGIDTLTEESSEKQHQEAKRLDGEAETAYRAIEAKLRALLAGVSAPAALASGDDDE